MERDKYPVINPVHVRSTDFRSFRRLSITALKKMMKRVSIPGFASKRVRRSRVNLEQNVPLRKCRRSVRSITSDRVKGACKREQESARFSRESHALSTRVDATKVGGVHRCELACAATVCEAEGGNGEGIGGKRKYTGMRKSSARSMFWDQLVLDRPFSPGKYQRFSVFDAIVFLGCNAMHLRGALSKFCNEGATRRATRRIETRFRRRYCR